MSVREIMVDAEGHGQRLDRFLCAHVERLGRAAARRLIEVGELHVNGRRAAAGSRLQEGDRVAFVEAPASSAAMADPDLPLVVRYEDAQLVVVDKPGGMPSHPLRPGELGTLASALLARYPEMAGVGYSPREPGILHRLDTDTSGLLLAARDAHTFAALRALLETGSIEKRYQALCAGAVVAPASHEAWLSARGRQVTLRMQPFGSAEHVRTELLEAAVHGGFSLVQVRVHVARRHQIRAHLAALGHPIAGDARYGGAVLTGLGHHFLHASELTFTHPHTGAQVAVQAPLPATLALVLEAV
jgi:23S rRNA pseudouridine1911/1915/1917 synthase